MRQRSLGLTSVVAAMLVIFPGTIQAAESCYDESRFPSVVNLEVLQDGFRIQAAGRHHDRQGKAAPTLTYTPGAGWRKTGTSPCPGPTCGAESQACNVKLPSIVLSDKEILALTDWTQIPDIEQKIGACVQHGDYVYFGIEFYQGEGTSGIGGIGRYNLKTKEMDIRRPKVLRHTSVNHILYDGKDLWFGTVGHYECTGTPPTKGLIRYEWDSRKTHRVRGLCGFVVHGLMADEDALWMATDFGISRLARGRAGWGRWNHFVSDLTTDSGMRQTTCEALYTEMLANLRKETTFLVQSPYYYLLENLVKFRPNFLMRYLFERTERAP